MVCKVHCICTLNSSDVSHFIYTQRIVWNGNDYYNDTDSAYDAVSINSNWMVVDGSTMVNQDASDSEGELYFWRTTLDRIGYATTPTSNYTESELGGSNKSFHGPFQRRMLLGTAGQNGAARNTGKWVHLMRYYNNCLFRFSNQSKRYLQ